jgi:hypothetical protein
MYMLYDITAFYHDEHDSDFSLARKRRGAEALVQENLVTNMIKPVPSRVWRLAIL